MLEISSPASARIHEFMTDRPTATLRIYLKPSLTERPSLGLTFDAPTDNDAIFTVDGLTYVVSQELLDRVQPIRIDFDSIGLRFSSRLDADDGGCGCGCGGH